MEKLEILNLHSEYDYLNQFSKQGVNSLNSLINFLKSFVKNGDQLYTNSRKSIEIMIQDHSKISKTLGKSMFEFGKSYENFIVKFKQILNKIDKDIVDPICQYQQQLININEDSLSNFKNIISSAIESKKSIDRIKSKYFDHCLKAKEQEKSILKSFADKEKNRVIQDEELKGANENLIKLRNQADNYAKTYKSEINKTNKFYEEIEKKYFLIVEKMKTNEESRIYFTKCQMEKFSKAFEEFAVYSCEFLNKINTSIVEIAPSEDINDFNENEKYIKEKIRFPREEFINYETLIKNKENDSTPKKLLSNSSHSSPRPLINILDSGTNFNFDFKNKFSEKETLQNKILDEFISRMVNEVELTSDEISRVMDILYENNIVAEIFLDKIFESKVSNRFYNLINLNHFTNIIITLTLNFESVENEKYDVNYVIISIAERTYFVNTNNTKVYLCALMSRNKLFSSKKYWMDLIELKINRRIETVIKRIIKDHQKIFKKGIFGKIKSVFRYKEIPPNLPENLTDSYETIKCNETLAVVDDFIHHFANFNFDQTEAVDIIMDLSSMYNFPSEKISYFVTKLNSNNFTIKNKLYLGSFKNEKINRRFLTLKESDKKLIIIKNTMKFIDQSEFPNFLLLNKGIMKKIALKLYKTILLKKENIPIEVRIRIWKNIVRVNGIKSRFNYQQILKEIDEKPSLTSNPVFDIITLDIQRTFFDSETENKRKIIMNILRALAVTKPQINYCQGMNYIASFISQLLNNEEEAFYFMLAMFENTEFCSIFLNDLTVLKQFFYVYDRLVSLFIPELSQVFKSNQVVVSYFSSPWFITLFTNSYQYIGDNDKPKILLRIWDEFFIYGWKSIMKTGVILLKYYENHLISLKYEDLLQFLINDIMKSGFFQNNNFNCYIESYSDLTIKSDLINNLENENLQIEKSNENEEKRNYENLLTSLQNSK